MNKKSRVIEMRCTLSTKTSTPSPVTQNYILQLHKILYSHMNNPMAGKTKMYRIILVPSYPDGHTETLFTASGPL